jgi:hypothetical protein
MSRLQDLFKKYGAIAIGVHLTVYAATLAGKRPSFWISLSTAYCTSTALVAYRRADLVLDAQAPTLHWSGR